MAPEQTEQAEPISASTHVAHSFTFGCERHPESVLCVVLAPVATPEDTRTFLHLPTVSDAEDHVI